MVRFVDGNNIQALLSSISQHNNATPLGYSSVSQGALRILSEEGFYVGGEASAVVDGLLRVLGTLDLSGTFYLSGTGRVAGGFTITGPFTVEGNTSMTGNLTSTGEFTLNGPVHINGNTDLNGVLTVYQSGRIIVQGAGDMNIGVLASGRAGIHFAGGELSSDNDQLALTSGGNFAGVGGGNSILGFGGNAVVVNSTGTHIYGPVFMHDLPDKPAGSGGGVINL